MAELLARIFEQGGWVSYALAMLSVLLWAAVYLRMTALRRGVTGGLHAYVRGRLAGGRRPEVRGILPEFVNEAIELRLPRDLTRLNHLQKRAILSLAFVRSVVRTLVAAAPLLGLLGTVAGMVEMFSSMHGGTASLTREATVAGGISTALITTQLGLVIGAPGLVAARLLSRRETRLAHEIREASSIILRSRGGT